MPILPDGQNPDWANHLGADGMPLFLEHIERYFSERGHVIALDLGKGVVTPLRQGQARSALFGLRNLAQKCAQTGREHWADLVRAHFDDLYETDGRDAAADIAHVPFEQISARLRVRLYPAGMLDHAPGTAARPVADGLIEALVLDMPKAVRTVSRREAGLWAPVMDDLFRLGRKQLSTRAPLDITRVPLPGSKFQMYTGDPVYGASHLLVFERYLKIPHPHGLLVCVPRHDVLLAHVIINIGVLEAAAGMLHTAAAMYEAGPGSLSQNLYWYRNGGLTLLPCSADEHEYSFEPPEEFQDLLHYLAARAHLS